MHCGYEVNILVEELQDIKQNKLEEFFDRNDILDKVIIEEYNIPTNKFFRIFKTLYLIGLNIFELGKLLKVLKKFNWTHDQVFKYQFFKKFRNYDIVHVQYGTNVKPLDIYKKIGLINGKLIVSFHGHDAFFPINGIIENNGYYDELFKYGDIIIANTRYLAQILENLGCPWDKLKIIPVGVDTDFFKPGKDVFYSREIFKIISVGRLDKVKGQCYAIEVLRLLKEKGYEVCLSIIGEGSERANLENLIFKYQLKEQIKLRGKLSRSEVKKAMGEHDLFVLPAVAVSNERRETQGLATLEAQACGLPAVVFDSGGVKYTVLNGETGFIVPEYDVEAMALSIEKLIVDEQLRKSMSIKAVEFVRKNFSQSELKKVWCDLYALK